MTDEISWKRAGMQALVLVAIGGLIGLAVALYYEHQSALAVKAMFYEGETTDVAQSLDDICKSKWQDYPYHDGALDYKAEYGLLLRCGYFDSEGTAVWHYIEVIGP